MMSNESRLRQHPSERFAASEKLIKLDQEIDALRNEPHKGIGGHRQKALYRHGPIECIVFVFEQGGCLTDHKVADGPIAIQVLEGALCVKTPDAQYEMTQDSLLLLAPGVVHSVNASQPSRMLLTVYLSDPNLSPNE